MRDFISQKPMFTQLMQASKQCMNAHPHLKCDSNKCIKEAIQCETIHPATMSQFNNYTFHTHPHNIPYPSEQDKITTKNFIFFAIKGDKNNGNDYIDEVLKKQPSAIITSQKKIYKTNIDTITKQCRTLFLLSKDIFIKFI